MGDTRPRAAVREETIAGYLRRLSSRAPTPGGGAVAALNVAQAAGLVGMGARFTTGPRYGEVAALAAEIAELADALRERSLDLAAEDEAAFEAVSEAYDLPRDDEVTAGRRLNAIRDAVAAAALPPATVVAAARDLLGLTERLLPVVNPTLVCDVAAAADAIAAAASSAQLNVVANLKDLAPADPRRRLLDDVADVGELVQRAAALRESVRRKVEA